MNPNVEIRMAKTRAAIRRLPHSIWRRTGTFGGIWVSDFVFVSCFAFQIFRGPPVVQPAHGHLDSALTGRGRPSGTRASRARHHCDFTPSRRRLQTPRPAYRSRFPLRSAAQGLDASPRRKASRHESEESLPRPHGPRHAVQASASGNVPAGDALRGAPDCPRRGPQDRAPLARRQTRRSGEGPGSYCPSRRHSAR